MFAEAGTFFPANPPLLFAGVDEDGEKLESPKPG